ncbi:MAG: aspartate/tyrosine/aromatic aminotransferase [Pseudomonadales bacterium]|nr:aspartate/tyrosine/aromatic aminotransferase [Pseudomonadales bacterium]
MSTIFETVPLAPRDPILGVTEGYNADPRPEKVNLGVGVYYDDAGKVPLLQSVRRAEALLEAEAQPRSYLPIDGVPGYLRAVQALVFGADAAALREARIATVQTLGGTGALRVAADFLRRFNPDAGVWISNPSWENHRALFEAAGFVVNAYPYYDPATRGLDFASMAHTLASLPAGSIVVLHVCCHNPTGADPTAEQWGRIIEIVRAGQLVPILDLAYQGFANGLDADAEPVRRFVAAGVPALVANSFSKNFSLYGERVGGLSLVTASADEATRALSQLKRIIRASYSNPPTHGARLVERVLTTPALRADWERELTSMRERIKAMRQALVEQVQAAGQNVDFSFVLRQNGMFSYSGLTREDVARLREEFGIYAVDSGRICVAALNSGNVARVGAAVATLLR